MKEFIYSKILVLTLGSLGITAFLIGETRIAETVIIALIALAREL